MKKETLVVAASLFLGGCAHAPDMKVADSAPIKNASAETVGGVNGVYESGAPDPLANQKRFGIPPHADEDFTAAKAELLRTSPGAKITSAYVHGNGGAEMLWSLYQGAQPPNIRSIVAIDSSVGKRIYVVVGNDGKVIEVKRPNW